MYKTNLAAHSTTILTASNDVSLIEVQAAILALLDDIGCICSIGRQNEGHCAKYMCHDRQRSLRLADAFLHTRNRSIMDTLKSSFV